MEWCNKISQDKTFNSVGYGWTNPILVVIKDLPKEVKDALKSSGSIAIKLNLDNGKCSSAEFYSDASSADAPYILEGNYNTWKSVVQGNLDVVQAVLSGNIRLAKGSLFDLARYTDAFVQLAKISSTIRSKFLA